MRFKNLCAILGFQLFGVTSAWSATIAVIDSGIDVEHVELANQIWVNPTDILGDNIDNDSNGFVDDIYGWNFSENNNTLIDYSYDYSYTPEVVKFFEIQQKILQGLASEEEITWMRETVKDPEFLKLLMTFGNYAHGTHVAGISASQDKSNRIIGIKLLPTESPLSKLTSKVTEKIEAGKSVNMVLDWVLRFGLDFLAKQQATLFGQIGSYVNGLGVDVVNGSFGISSAAVMPLIEKLLQVVTGTENPDKKLVEKYAAQYIRRFNVHGRKMLVAAPKTLFVFAAGNDGTDNGIHPISPANMKEFNAITVAATFSNGNLAPFSNYSQALVDIAAPGVNIDSPVPGGNRLAMSGTSQAAPLVAGVAAAIIERNPDLNVLDVKHILMQTVDKISALRNKVKAGGIVNSKRALFAAERSVVEPLSEAIVSAKAAIGDMVVRDMLPQEDFEGFVLPLRPFIDLK